MSDLQVDIARDYAKKFNKNVVIVLTVDGERVEQTKESCVAARSFADDLLDACKHRFFEANGIFEGDE